MDCRGGRAALPQGKGGVTLTAHENIPPKEGSQKKNLTPPLDTSYRPCILVVDKLIEKKDSPPGTPE